MDRDEKTKDRADLSKWLVDSTPVVAGFLVSQGAQHLGADGFAAGGLGLLVARVAASFSPAAQRRLQPFLRGWLGGTKTEDVGAYWDRVATAEAAQEAVFVAVDRLRSILDPAAAEVLGRLTGEYVEADKFPDAFFRDFAALLTEIHGEELEELTKLCAFVSGLKESPDSLRLSLQMEANGTGQIRFFKMQAGSGNLSQESILGFSYTACEATRRLFGLLSNNGLVERSSRAEPAHLDLRRADLLRITHLVAPSGEGTP